MGANRRGRLQESNSNTPLEFKREKRGLMHRTHILSISAFGVVLEAECKGVSDAFIDCYDRCADGRRFQVFVFHLSA